MWIIVCLSDVENHTHLADEVMSHSELQFFNNPLRVPPLTPQSTVTLSVFKNYVLGTKKLI